MATADASGPFQWPLIDGMVAVNDAGVVAVESKSAVNHVSFSRDLYNADPDPRILSRPHVSSAVLSGITAILEISCRKKSHKSAVFNPVFAKRGDEWTPGRPDDVWIEAHEIGLALNMSWVLFIKDIHTLRVDYKQAEGLLFCRSHDGLVDVMIAKTVADDHQPSGA